MQIHAHLKVNPGGFNDANVIEAAMAVSLPELAAHKSGKDLSAADVAALRARSTAILESISDRVQADLDLLADVAARREGKREADLEASGDDDGPVF